LPDASAGATSDDSNRIKYTGGASSATILDGSQKHGSTFHGESSFCRFHRQIARSTNQGRAEFMDSLMGFPGQVRSIGSDNLEIHVWGDIAVLTGVQTAEIEFAAGQTSVNTIAITNIFQKQQGYWIMKLSHAIALE
jgi:hypothetical protein